MIKLKKHFKNLEYFFLKPDIGDHKTDTPNVRENKII